MCPRNLFGPLVLKRVFGYRHLILKCFQLRVGCLSGEFGNQLFVRIPALISEEVEQVALLECAPRDQLHVFESSFDKCLPSNAWISQGDASLRDVELLE